MDMQAQEQGYDVNGQMLTEEQHQEHIKSQVQGVQSRLVKQRDEWVQYRSSSGVEDRWRRSSQLYFNDDQALQSASFVETLKTGPASKKQGPARSTVVINIVRPKVDQAVARMSEILLPVDDQNWGIKPTPVPKSVSRMIGNPAPTVVPGTSTPTGLSADQEAQAVVRACKEAAKGMQDAIADALTECKYNGEQRKGLENGVRLGTMILKGPFPAKQTSKAWVVNPDGSSSMTMESATVPASASCDPWDVWFDPACGNDHQRGAGVWQKRNATRKELRALCEIDGYDADAIRDVLKNAPQRLRVAEGRVLRERTKDDSYELWEYHGEIEPEDMALCSMNTGDPLDDVAFGVLIMVGDTVIGAMDSWVEDKTLPYDVWCWRKSDDSPYGHSLPEELEHQQRVVNSAWRQVMDNARVAVGSQIVFKRGVITPVDGSYEITPNKLWEAMKDTEDVSKAFATFDFPSHLQDLLAIANAAMQFADAETSMPQLMGGEKGTAPETVGGMVMLFNAASGVLRMRVKLYDDGITVPHIGRHFDWQMVNNKDQAIKGDMEIDARGSTALLEKDIQNQATLNLANITSNPRYQPYLDAKEELKVILKSFKIQPADIMLSDDKIKQAEANQPEAPPDPRIAAAQMVMESKKLDIEDRKAARQADAQDAAELRTLKREELQYSRQKEQGEFEIAQTATAVNRDTVLVKLASEERNSAAERASSERLTTLEIDTKRQLFNAEASLRVRTGQGI